MYMKKLKFGERSISLITNLKKRLNKYFLIKLCVSANPCNKPTISDGTVAPTSATIASGSKYTVTCSTGFTLSGDKDVTCTNGVLSTLPTCEGIHTSIIKSLPMFLSTIRAVLSKENGLL